MPSRPLQQTDPSPSEKWEQVKDLFANQMVSSLTRMEAENLQVDLVDAFNVLEAFDQNPQAGLEALQNRAPSLNLDNPDPEALALAVLQLASPESE